MAIDYEKLVYREVARRVRADSEFFEDLLQEGRIAVWQVLPKVDEALPEEKRVAYIRQAIRWKINRAFRVWLRGLLLVSSQSLRNNAADLDRVDRNLPDWKKESVPSSEDPLDEFIADKEALEKIFQVFSELDVTNEEQEVLKGLLEGEGCRGVGQRIGKSHQGVLNIQKRLLARIREALQSA